MEEIKKINLDKLNTEEQTKPAENLPEVPRTATGQIDLDKISTGKNEKGNYIVPDEVMKAYYKELPNGTVNQSGTYTAYNKGLLKTLTDDIRRKGAAALNAELAQRRKISDTVQIMLAKKATPEQIANLNLPEGATQQDALIAAMLLQATERGNVQAGIFIRDTAGEKPTDKISAEVETITAEDRERIQRILNRTQAQDIDPEE